MCDITNQIERAGRALGMQTFACITEVVGYSRASRTSGILGGNSQLALVLQIESQSKLNTKGNWMKRTAGILSLVSIAVLLVASGCSTLHKSDAATLQGTWTGRDSGDNTGGECCLVISGKSLEFRGANADEWYKGTFSLREDVNPKQVVFSITECAVPKYNGKTSYALYQIENGMLTFAANEPGSPTAPSSFDAADSRRFVLKKK